MLPLVLLAPHSRAIAERTVLAPSSASDASQASKASGESTASAAASYAQLHVAILMSGDPLHDARDSEEWYKLNPGARPDLRVASFAKSMDGLSKMAWPALYVFADGYANSWKPFTTVSGLGNHTVSDECRDRIVSSQWQNLWCSAQLMEADEKLWSRKFDFVVKMRPDFPITFKAEWFAADTSMAGTQVQAWRDEALCGEYRAIDRAKWLAKNKGLSDKEAKLQVMREFPETFASARSLLYHSATTTQALIPSGVDAFPEEKCVDTDKRHATINDQFFFGSSDVMRGMLYYARPIAFHDERNLFQIALMLNVSGVVPVDVREESDSSCSMCGVTGARHNQTGMWCNVGGKGWQNTCQVTWELSSYMRGLVGLGPWPEHVPGIGIDYYEFPNGDPGIPQCGSSSRFWRLAKKDEDSPPRSV